MYFKQPDLQLRNAIISYFWAKGDYVTEFLTDYKIESVRVCYIKHNEKIYRTLIIKPKVSTRKTKDSIVIGIGVYSKRFDIGNIKAIVNHHKDLERQFFNVYKEPYPGYYENDKPWANAKKKQKPKKRR